MYKMQPLVTHGEKLPSPSHTMYRINPLVGFGDKNVQPCGSDGSTESQGSVAALERQQDSILEQLKNLKVEVTDVRSLVDSIPTKMPALASNTGCLTNSQTPADIVICVSPKFAPYSLLGLANLLGASFPIELKSYTHSSVSEIPAIAKKFCKQSPGAPRMTITVVWKDVGPNMELVVNPLTHTAIRGEAHLLRYLSRVGPECISYESDTNLKNITLVDEILDVCQRLALCSKSKEKQIAYRSLNASLGKSPWLCGRSKISIADIAAWSVLQQTGKDDVTPTLKEWLERCDSFLC